MTADLVLRPRILFLEALPTISGGQAVLLDLVSQLRKALLDMLNYAVRLPRLIFFTWRLIRRERIDLVYANSARTFVRGTCSAALAGRPIIWHHHSLLTGRKTLALLQFIGRWQTVRRIIAVSEAAAQFPTLKNKMTVIPTGVDTELFRPDSVARTGRPAAILVSRARKTRSGQVCRPNLGQRTIATGTVPPSRVRRS